MINLGTKYAKPIRVKKIPLGILGLSPDPEDPSKVANNIFANPQNKETEAIIVQAAGCI
jgi:hypothetical protein